MNRLQVLADTAIAVGKADAADIEAAKILVSLSQDQSGGVQDPKPKSETSDPGTLEAPWMPLASAPRGLSCPVALLPTEEWTDPVPAAEQRRFSDGSDVIHTSPARQGDRFDEDSTNHLAIPAYTAIRKASERAEQQEWPQSAERSTLQKPLLLTQYCERKSPEETAAKTAAASPAKRARLKLIFVRGKNGERKIALPDAQTIAEFLRQVKHNARRATVDMEEGMSLLASEKARHKEEAMAWARRIAEAHGRRADPTAHHLWTHPATVLEGDISAAGSSITTRLRTKKRQASDEAEEEDQQSSSGTDTAPFKRLRLARVSSQETPIPTGDAAMDEIRARVSSISQRLSRIRALRTLRSTSSSFSTAPPLSVPAVIPVASSSPSSSSSTTTTISSPAPALVPQVSAQTGGGSRRYACPEPRCPRRFKRAEHARRHWDSMHAPIRSWACSCGREFARRDNMQAHKQNMGHY